MALVIHRRVRTDGSMAERRIMIGDNIIVTLVKINRNQVVLSIEAPKSVQINREEILTPDQVRDIEIAAKVK